MKNATGIKKEIAKNENVKLTFKQKATMKLLQPLVEKVINTAYNQTKFYIELNCENGNISKMPTQEEYANSILNELKGE